MQHSLLFPVQIKDEIVDMKKNGLREENVILFYITPNFIESLPLEKWFNILKEINKNFTFHIFVPKQVALLKNMPHVFFHHHGDDIFLDILGKAKGIITTAGHNMLSEAMYLEKPVYVMPLPVYEQQINAFIIEQNHFGIMSPTLEKEKLLFFINNLEKFKKNIQNDIRILNKDLSKNLIVKEIESILFK